MITCKEDLVNRYVNAENEELLELFYQACDKFGLKWLNGKGPRDYEFFRKRIGVERDLTIRQGFLCESYSELTLSDFKLVRTEYAQVTESIFDLRESLESGELYERVVAKIRPTSITEGSGVSYEYEQIKSELDLFKLVVNGDVIYRKVEKEVDERQEFIDELRNIQMEMGDCHLFEFYDAIYDSGKFKLVRANGEVE